MKVSVAPTSLAESLNRISTTQHQVQRLKMPSLNTDPHRPNHSQQSMRNDSKVRVEDNCMTQRDSGFNVFGFGNS